MPKMCERCGKEKCSLQQINKDCPRLTDPNPIISCSREGNQDICHGHKPEEKKPDFYEGIVEKVCNCENFPRSAILCPTCRPAVKEEVITDTSLKPGEWVKESGVPIRSNPPVKEEEEGWAFIRARIKAELEKHGKSQSPETLSAIITFKIGDGVDKLLSRQRSEVLEEAEEIIEQFGRETFKSYANSEEWSSNWANDYIKAKKKMLAAIKKLKEGK